MSFQDRIQNQISQLDKELSKYPALSNLERQTQVPKAYAALGVAGLYFFLIVFNFGGQLLTNLSGFIIPAYYSMEALLTASKTDDTQWLTYWVVFALFTVFESAVNAVYWFPFYYTFKFIFTLWLALPQFGGAQLVFTSVVQPLLGRFFTGSSTSAGLRAKAEAAAEKMQ